MQIEKRIGKASESANQQRTSIHASVLLVLVYLWFLIATPDIRFPFFALVRFERVLVFLLALTLLFSGRIYLRPSPFTPLLVLFFCWLLIGYFLSPYQSSANPQWWIENYWKVLLFYFFVLFSLEKLEELSQLFIGIAVISLLYQLHSWHDFLSGGSYVFQQGLKRMVGVWSGGGIGAANAYGMLGLISAPFGIFWFYAARTRPVKMLALFFLFVCFASVLFSGTRAALVGLVFLFIVGFGSILRNVKVALVVIVALATLLAVLPADLRHRYFNLILVEEGQVQDDFDKIATESAESRVQGLLDGWELFLRRPLFGYGPGASEAARQELRPPSTADKQKAAETLQLHNLYGQLLSEAGLGGTLVFFAMVSAYLLQLRRLKRLVGKGHVLGAPLLNYRNLLRNTMLLMLFYGFFSHTLYRYHWLLLFASHAALMHIVTRQGDAAGRTIPSGRAARVWPLSAKERPAARAVDGAQRSTDDH